MSLRNEDIFSTTDDEIVIKAEHVSKKFSKSLKRSMIYGMKDITRNVFGLSSNSDRLRKSEFWALDDVSFEVRKGECLGIIGSNGAGKTTLLSILNGIYMPDKGKITLKGKTGALIALGAGFHPMLTGRENIYVKGAVLGMNKTEINEKYDAIVEFADLGDFLDMPVKNYSSGMYVRLGFSVAIHCQPEILLIDEVLSVGDMAFQNKCLRRLAEIRENANAVVFVSHNMRHIRTLCDRVLILDQGRTIFMGETYDAVQKYEEITRDKRLQDAKRFEKVVSLGVNKYYSSDAIEFLEGGIMDDSGRKIDTISIEDDVIPFLRFHVKDPLENVKISIAIVSTKQPIDCISQYSNDKDQKKLYEFEKGEYLVNVKFKNPKLSPGVYTISYSIRNQKTGEIYEKNRGYMPAFKVTGKAFERGLIYAESEWNVKRIDDGSKTHE